MIEVQLNKLSLYQQNRWLFRDLDISVPSGSFVGISGPSGVGKSSLLRLMAGMCTPSKGGVSYTCSDKADTLSPERFRNRLGIIFQNFLLTPNGRVIDNVLCGRLRYFPFWKTMFGFSKELKEEAYAQLCSLGLGTYCLKPVSCLSGGEQQRTAIARALFQNPDVILADEPVSQLDEKLKKQVLQTLKQQTIEANKTVFCVLHDPEAIHVYADYKLTLDPDFPDKWTFEKIRQHT